MDKPLWNFKVDTKAGRIDVVGSDWTVDEQTGTLLILSGIPGKPPTGFARGFWERCLPLDQALTAEASTVG